MSCLYRDEFSSANYKSSLNKTVLAVPSFTFTLSISPALDCSTTRNIALAYVSNPVDAASANVASRSTRENGHHLLHICNGAGGSTCVGVRKEGEKEAFPSAAGFKGGYAG